MATASVTQLRKIEFEDGHDISLCGLVAVLTRRNTRVQPDFNFLGALTERELMTVSNQARNIGMGALEGLNTVGKMISAYEAGSGEFDHNCVGWLTCHLSETVRAMRDLEHEADSELVTRGYDSMGMPLRQPSAA